MGSGFIICGTSAGNTGTRGSDCMTDSIGDSYSGLISGNTGNSNLSKSADDGNLHDQCVYDCDINNDRNSSLMVGSTCGDVFASGDTKEDVGSDGDRHVV